MSEVLDSVLQGLAQQPIGGGLGAIDIEVALGCVLGAVLFTTARKRLKTWLRVLVTLSLSAGAGYLFAPLVLAMFPVLSGGVGAFIAALVVVPLSIKVMQWLDQADLKEILQRWRKGG